MTVELGLIGGLWTALLIFAFYTYNQMKLLRTEATALRQELTLKVMGLQDHVSGIRSDTESFQKELAEFANNLEGDEIKKVLDRLSVLEMSVGIRRLDSAKKISDKR